MSGPRPIRTGRNWVFIAEAATTPTATIGALLDAAGAPVRRSKDGEGRWVHRRELLRALRLRHRLDRILAAEVAAQDGCEPVRRSHSSAVATSRG